MSTALMNDDYSNPSSINYQPSPSPTPSPKNSLETYPNSEESSNVHDPVFDSKASSVKLDISGDFPYFEPDDEDEEKFIANLDPDKDLTQHQSEKLEEYTLRQHGYVRTSFIAKTLQGQVFNATLSKNGKSENVVIKKTSKKLHKLGITITKKGKKVAIQEDIVTEAKVLKSFHANSPPASLIGFYGFFEDSHFYYLCMERGGTDYFDFIVKCHDMITKNELSLTEWRKQCKFMFAQMVQFVQWMHKTMHCAHLDISLENILIRPTSRYDADSQTLSSCYIKFIDFGLTEFFDLSQNPSWNCQKFVGKTHYKAPKVYAKKESFCANKADIWSLGVCLFMMVVGAPPYNKPIERDITYQYVKYGQIAKLLQEWQRIKYVTANLHDLLSRMLCFDESQRITMDELVKHPWIKQYFPEFNNEEKSEETTTPSSNEKLENSMPSQSRTTLVSSPPLDDESDFNKENYANANDKQRVPVSTSSSSISQSYSMQISPVSVKICNISKHSPLNKINVMAAQQCASMSSVSSFSSQHRTPSSVRYASPYQSRSPISPYQSPIAMATASPIIQSHTSASDHYCASIENERKGTKYVKIEDKTSNEKRGPKKKKKRKKPSKFFKLFGGR